MVVLALGADNFNPSSHFHRVSVLIITESQLTELSELAADEQTQARSTQDAVILWRHLRELEEKSLQILFTEPRPRILY